MLKLIDFITSILTEKVTPKSVNLYTTHLISIFNDKVHLLKTKINSDRKSLHSNQAYQEQQVKTLRSHLKKNKKKIIIRILGYLICLIVNTYTFLYYF